MLVWCNVQLVLIKFNKVVHGILNSVHWSQITELASDLDSVDLRAPVINYLKGIKVKQKIQNSANGRRVGKTYTQLQRLFPKNSYYV
jgi:hypothetical protein